MRKTGIFAIMTATVVGFFAASPTPTFAAFGFSDCGQMPGISALFNNGQNQPCPTLPSSGCPTTNTLLSGGSPSFSVLPNGGNCPTVTVMPNGGCQTPGLSDLIPGFSDCLTPVISPCPQLPGVICPDDTPLTPDDTPSGIPTLPIIPAPEVPTLPGIPTPDVPVIPAPDIPTIPDAPIKPDTPPTDGSQDTYANQVVLLVNQEREKAGLSPLSINTTAAGAAMVRAQETERSFSHTRPDGRSFSTALTDAGLTYRTSGENIAYGQRSASEVMNAWMNSSGHRANILNADFTQIGVAHYKNASGVDYWVQLFLN